MIKINEAVIVEGKYDKLKLSNIIDAMIIETNGFQIFKDKEMQAFIKRLADERGIIILTDSDHSGFQIRNFVAMGIDKSHVKNIFIPDIYGKEKRKKQPSKEGKLGVEGIDDSILTQLFEKQNISYNISDNRELVTNYDLYSVGISGGENSRQNKKEFLAKLNLPKSLSTKMLLQYINSSMTREEFLSYFE